MGKNLPILRYTMRKTIEEIAKEDGRYSAMGLKYVHDGLGQIVQKIRESRGYDPEPHHISGQDLAMGLAELSVERWGRLAKMVFARWGINCSRDLGEIVYLMIANEWMTAQETDTIEDFDDVFDFETMFEKQFKFELK